MRARAALAALVALTAATTALAARAPSPAPAIPTLPADIEAAPQPTPVATAVAAAEAADAAREAVAAGKAPLAAAPSNWTAAGGRLNSTGATPFALAAGGRDGAPLLAVAPPGDGGRVRLLRLDGAAWADAAAPLDPPPGGELAALAAAADGRVYLAFSGEPPRGDNTTLPALYATDAAGPRATWTKVVATAPAAKPAAKRGRDADADAAPDAVPARDVALATDGADAYLVTAFADRGSGVSAARLDGASDGARKGRPSLDDLEAPAKGATASRVRAAAGGGVLAVAYGDVPGNKVVVRWREIKNATAAAGGSARGAKAKAGNAGWRDACGGALPESGDQLVNPVAVGADGEPKTRQPATPAPLIPTPDANPGPHPPTTRRHHLRGHQPVRRGRPPAPEKAAPQRVGVRAARRVGVAPAVQRDDRRPGALARRVHPRLLSGHLARRRPRGRL